MRTYWTIATGVCLLVGLTLLCGASGSQDLTVVHDGRPATGTNWDAEIRQSEKELQQATRDAAEAGRKLTARTDIIYRSIVVVAIALPGLLIVIWLILRRSEKECEANRSWLKEEKDREVRSWLEGTVDDVTSPQK